MDTKVFNKNDRVFYMLPRGYGRKQVRYLPATVLNVTKKRVVIRVDGENNHRNTLPTNLTASISPD